MAGRNDDKFRCSFCGKTQDQVRKLIAGPNGAYICDECVDICAEIIDEELENDEAAGEVAEPEEQINLLKPEDMVVMDLNGNKVEGRYNPSSDTPTHLELYKAFPEIGGIVHTHSTYATSWAQAGRAIPCYGTTHADYMYGEIPCARVLTQEEIDAGYEKNTGTVIIETFEGKDPMAVPAVLCKNHGPFAWGKDAKEAVHNAVVLEEVAKMALFTEQLKPDVEPAPQRIQDKHYYRKHGANAYYGNKVE